MTNDAYSTVGKNVFGLHVVYRFVCDQLVGVTWLANLHSQVVLD